MDTVNVLKSCVVFVLVLGLAQSATVYTRRICTCNILATDQTLHMVIEPNTTYEAWPSVSCHHARRQCRKHCHQEIKLAIDAIHNNEGPLYKPHPKDGRRLGFDLCVQYGTTTPEQGIELKLRSEVEHCRTKDIDPDWKMQLCCGYSTSPMDNDDKKLFGWYPNCPQKDTIVFA